MRETHNANNSTDHGSSSNRIASLAKRLGEFIAQVGLAKAGKALRTTPARLNAILTGVGGSETIKLWQSIAGRLPSAILFYAKLDQDRRAELTSLKALVERDGLRATARRLRVDPSNLRRRID